ncbi:MAG: DUF1566 domain-containing protein [Flavobacterium sp.]|uniref:Lcl domain-containing protein n=1 Tax=Flavobacterium sp. TaxID=239 RepID=UPI0026067324|nr:DUF1566 domain-containing protein [Flavobacterium sp.]MDD5150997.1 DUF1566 domain-containing protein [Flavobacterium sp.]
MKKITLTFLTILFVAGILNAQTGIGTTTPDDSAILDVSSSTKGFLFPRMTTLERDAIVNPATGLTIFNLTSNALEINKGTTITPLWTASTGIQGIPGLLTAGNATGNTPFWDGTSWITNSSNLYNNGGNIGIGTTNPLTNFHINGNVNNRVGALISNASNASNAFSILSLTNNTSNGLHLFLNSSTRLSDGGINDATLRNDAGNLLLQSQGAVGLTIQASTGKVGVNNTSPTETLDVVGKTKTTALQITSGAVAGKVLTSDASGNATWQNSSMPAGTAVGQMNYWNGTAWVLVPPGTQDQTLTFCNGKPTWGPCLPILTIGQNYQGGTIAYLDATEQHGLIVGPMYNYSLLWGCEGVTVGAVSNSGLTNTGNIIAVCADTSAAKTCYDLISNGYEDWYLPSKEEMQLIYPNKALLGYKDFAYWTSSEDSSTQAWYIQMTNGNQGTTVKGATFPFRPVRSF